MAQTGAARQRAFTQRRQEELDDLRRRVAECEGRKTHVACDQTIADLRAEIARLKGQVRF